MFTWGNTRNSSIIAPDKSTDEITKLRPLRHFLLGARRMKEVRWARSCGLMSVQLESCGGTTLLSSQIKWSWWPIAWDRGGKGYAWGVYCARRADWWWLMGQIMRWERGNFWKLLMKGLDITRTRKLILFSAIVPIRNYWRNRDIDVQPTNRSRVENKNCVQA